MNEVLTSASEIRNSTRNREWLLSLYMRFYLSLEAALNPVKSEHFSLNIPQDIFQKVHGQILPAIKQPIFFTEGLGEEVLELILKNEIVKDFQPQIESIFKNSYFNNDDLQYKTVLNGSKSVIYGCKNNTWQSLIGITHELGHCISEGKHGYRSFASQLRSEYLAQILEENLVRNVLLERNMTTELKQWHRYQRIVDLLNFYFAIREYEELSNLSFIKSKIFSKTAEALRETFIRNTGYQLVYGFASLNRWPKNYTQSLYTT